MKASRRLRIWRRDSWACRMPECLCPDGRAIDRELAGAVSDWAPTVDHVIPRRAGGRDGYANLRAAHRKCNNLAGSTYENPAPPKAARRPRLAYFDAFPQMERRAAGSVYGNPEELRQAWAARS